jgi:hypothetical protein
MEVNLPTPVMPVDLVKNLIKNIKAAAPFAEVELALGRAIMTAIGVVKTRPLIGNNPGEPRSNAPIPNRNLLVRIETITVFRCIHQGFLQTQA